ncbi:hypothetical protein AYO21_03856 [Fonsecaea monophora]|uniref:Uncharacterized protein n=1 Tax=Fonsecaea monophora TaxID=254056 RepID=A0A177FC25_9EURO|nr:hypothetical protein AYO21_03856 [Fonsecaea monophora]OAG41853.1 hypothetical protein AYO21_03856 [Fonsecaea monophora]
MSKSVASRISICCWRSLFPELRPQHFRRTLVTLQRGPVEKREVPSDLPSQYWSQIPERFRPDRGKREIVIHQAPRSETETCKDPVSVVDSRQLTLLDPTGARAKLFDKTNKDRAKVGDILLATFTSGEPVSGVILSIKGSGPHTARHRKRAESGRPVSEATSHVDWWKTIKPTGTVENEEREEMICDFGA